MGEGIRVYPVNIEEEMKRSYLDYAMSVIIGRALPDVRDGLKPVHRRILFSMHELGNQWNKRYKKSARVVGDVIGKYHPHGDTAVYDALVRMVQDFSLRYPLGDGQGNFGSIDGDSAAAMRYTEVRMTKLAGELLANIEKNTVEMIPNYDGSLKEPVVLPARVPNLLINGGSGIAVGMATNIPPHNLREVVKALVALIDNGFLTNEELMGHILAPDFPTGGIIYGTEGIREAYMTGRGSVTIRSDAFVEQVKRGDRQSIVVTSIPYQVNKSRLVEKVAELVKGKEIEEISDIRDESDRDGTRVVFELKKGAIPEIVLNKLYKKTQMQNSYGIQLLAIARNQPKTFNLKEILTEFIHFRKEIVTRRTLFDLNRAKARAHILEGFLIALKNLEAVIQLIRKSKDVKSAQEGLVKVFSLSEIQAKAILEMRLQRLTGLERKKIKDEYEEIQKEIKKLELILADEKALLSVIKEELREVAAEFGDDRRSQIIETREDINLEDLIMDEEMVVTVTHNAYIKRSPISIYRAQKRGGRGKIGMGTKEEDFVAHLFIASTHSYLMFFSNKGRVFWKKVHEIPEVSRTGRGRAIINLLPVSQGEVITAVLPVKEFSPGNYILMATEKGVIKKTDMMEFSRPRSSGIIALTLKEDDNLMNAAISSGEDDVIIITQKGFSIRFSEKDVRPMGRQAAGVRGIALKKDDKAVRMDIVREEGKILTVTELGYGKRTDVGEYRRQSRGGKGIITLKVTERTGNVVGSILVSVDDQVMLISDSGKIIRLRVNEIRTVGRNTQGVKLMGIEREEERLQAVAKLAEKEE